MCRAEENVLRIFRDRRPRYVLPHGTLHIHEAGSLRGPPVRSALLLAFTHGNPTNLRGKLHLSPLQIRAAEGSITDFKGKFSAECYAQNMWWVSWMLEENSLPLEPNSDFSSWGEWSLISTTELSTNRQTNSPWMSSCDTVIYNKTDILSFILLASGTWLLKTSLCNILYKSLGASFGYAII